jgi:hypothetical protein
MEMQEPLADNIVINATRAVGGRQQVSMDDALSSVGIASAAQLAQLVHLVVQVFEQAGFEVNLEIFGTISKHSTLLQVRNMVLPTAVSGPRICKDGHVIPAGAIFCAFGHSAKN